MIEHDDCPSENEIVGFLEGTLSDPERARIEAHCASCERCREGLAHATQDAVATASSGEDASGPLRREIESVVHGVLADAASSDELVGKPIGRFEILAVQGHGQFGTVYRARDTQLGRLVAVKVMRRTGWRDRATMEALFHTEAAAAARLQHPSIVTLHDYGEFEGAPYLILELLDGETLRSRLVRDGPMPARDALAIAGDVARALVEAHAAGVIHRDIKPGNVFLCTSGQTKVLDFGLAQLQSEVDPVGTAAARAGTPLYMAPELFRGHPADACTDVYAAGVTLLEAVAGPVLPGGPPIAARIAAVRIPPRIRRLIASATASDRAERFQDAGELLAALTRVQRQLAWRGRPGRWLGVGLAGALVATAAAVAVAVAYRAAPSQSTAKPAVAVLGFDNLSGRGDLAWLSTALSEVLDAELAASPAVRVVSAEAVVHARADLAVPEGGHLDPGPLHDLRKHLGADYLVLGSYLPEGSDAGHKTRLDVRIQDAWGVLLDTFSETAGDADLIDLMARFGSRLRVRLAGTAITPEELRASRASMPTRPEAVRLYAEGLRRWRSSELAEARDLLARAAAVEPSFPLAHSALSQVLHTLGEQDQMRDEAKLAFDLSHGLRMEERLLVEARYREAIDQWPRALALRHQLRELLPDDLETGLELVDALEQHQQLQEARAVIADLRRLPAPWRDDLRIDLAEIWGRTEPGIRKALAIATAGKARSLGARWVLARAREREASAERELGELGPSLAAAEEGRAIDEALGDREGLAIALYEIATTRAVRGDPISVVVAAYEQVLRAERQIGNRDQAANMLGNIAYEYLEAGDPAQAAIAIDEMENLATGFAQAKAAQHRGEQWLEQGELERAFAQLERVWASGKPRGFALKLLGDVLMAQGQLEQAGVRLEQYLALGWPPEDSLRVVGVLARSRLEVEAGQPERAEADARNGIAICERTHDGSDLAAARAALARALVAERRFEEARVEAEAAWRLADHLEVAPAWIDARIALAQARFGLSPGDVDAALAQVQAALDRARERGLPGQVYAARLAGGEIAAQAHRPIAARQLRALADEADQHGFGLIARKARAAAAAVR